MNLKKYMMDEMNFDRIEDFLDGDLTENQLKEFEKDLLEDLDLQMELDLHTEVNDAIMEQDVMDLRSKLEAIETPHNPAEKRKLKFLTKWNITAASLALVIGLGSLMYILNNPSTYSNDKVFSNYYKPYNVVVNTRSSDVMIDNLLVTALKSYETKDYRTALTLFKKILDKDSTNITGNFYSGISNIEINEYSKANKNFTRVLKHKNNLFIEQSEWYLGFCYLMTNEKEKALKQFHVIAQGNSFYKTKALEIINRLE
ncbi:MAG: tol-pal system YbgF family protein [Labilibaculum antarcticum]